MTDLVIRNGTIIDGTGAPGYIGDVAIDDGIITAVGEVDTRGHREIEADGLLITPGFVDIHTHFDGQVTWDPIVAPSSLHGVTTIAMGNCGVGFAPAHTDKHAWLIGLLEGVVVGDANVIDLNAWECRIPHLVHDLPTGGRRLMQEADGYRATVKAGTVTFENGTHTGELPGRLLRGVQTSR